MGEPQDNSADVTPDKCADVTQQDCDNLYLMILQMQEKALRQHKIDLLSSAIIQACIVVALIKNRSYILKIINDGLQRLWGIFNDLCSVIEELNQGVEPKDKKT